MRIRKLLLGTATALALLLWSPALAGAQEGGEGSEPEVNVDAEGAEEDHGELSEEAEHCIHTLEEGGDPEDCHESPSPILPATDEIIWGGLSFLVLFGVIAKFGYPAIAGMMTARTERIRASIDEADAAQAQAQTVLAEYQAQLADARAESGRIIEEARQQAEQVRRDLIARAEAEAVELRQRNAEQVAGERDRVMAEVQGQVATLAIELAEKVVGSNLDRDANLQLIENYINTVGTGR